MAIGNKCTWKDCQEIAVHPQLDKFKREWANLCDTHHRELESRFDSMDPKKMLSGWALAKSEESRKRDIEGMTKGAMAILKMFGEKK
jgi:hypothetical protein